MKITVISSTLFPSSEKFYGSEHMAMHLADELGKNHDVTFFAAPKTPDSENYDLMLMPSTHGRVHYLTETFPYEEHKDVLLESDYLIDMSATHKPLEEIFWYEDFDGLMIWSRNGTSATNPRIPVRLEVPGVCLSEAAKTKITRNFGVPESNLHIIPYGIDTEIYSPEGGKEDFILYLGAPRKAKGLETILDIAESLPEERFRLAWNARTEEHKRVENEIKQKAKKRNLSNLEFIELEEDHELEMKVSLYRKAKCFLQPTEKKYIEAWGLCLTEALSCGTPIITATHGAHPELVGDGKVGFLCDDLDGYIKAIKRIDEIDPAKCRKHILENGFAKQDYARKYLDLYRDLGGEKN